MDRIVSARGQTIKQNSETFINDFNKIGEKNDKNTIRNQFMLLNKNFQSHQITQKPVVNILYQNVSNQQTYKPASVNLQNSYNNSQKVKFEHLSLEHQHNQHQFSHPHQFSLPNQPSNYIQPHSTHLIQSQPLKHPTPYPPSAQAPIQPALRTSRTGDQKKTSLRSSQKGDQSHPTTSLKT